MIETSLGLSNTWTGLIKICTGWFSIESSSNPIEESISSSKSSIAISSTEESIIVTTEVVLALMPSAITVPFLITSPSSTFNSEMLDKVWTSPGLIVTSWITSLYSLNSTIPSMWQYTSFTTSVPAVTEVPFSTILSDESLLIW